MSFEAALSARLLGDAAYAQAVGGRIDWMRRPNGLLPATVLQIISDPRRKHYRGRQPRRTTVQVDIWSTSFAEAVQLRDATIRLLEPAGLFETVKFQEAEIVNVRPGFEQLDAGSNQQPRGELYRESIDFIFMHNAI